MAVQAKRFNWIAKRDTWQQMQEWREKRAVMRDQFSASSQDASARLAAAFTSQSTGMADIAARQANARMQAEYRARVDKTIAGLDFSV